MHFFFNFFFFKPPWLQGRAIVLHDLEDAMEVPFEELVVEMACHMRIWSLNH